MSDEIDPRLVAAADAFSLSLGAPCYFDAMRAALAAADASDAERGIVGYPEIDVETA